MVYTLREIRRAEVAYATGIQVNEAAASLLFGRCLYFCVSDYFVLLFWNNDKDNEQYQRTDSGQPA